MSHPGGVIFTHTADTEYGGVLRVRLYDRATIKCGCSTRAVPVGVTFARRSDEKERERRNGEERGTGEGRKRHASGNGHEQLYYFRDVTTSEDPESSVQKR